ncbi:MAG TPA: hypothetical protein PKY99_15185 [Turneriella sp.]|nr:hypothetical protein [Turneriella sp.]
MKLLKIAAIIAVLILGLFFGFYAYMGGFSKVEVTRAEYGPAEILYATHKGSYRTISKSWGAFQKQWEAAGLKECQTLAVYLDAPGTPEDQLRSILGCRIDALSSAEKQSLRGKLPHFTLPKSRVLMSTFPYKNVASFFIAPGKVYPEFQKIMSAEKIMPPVGIEVYGTMTSVRNISFYMPVEGKREDYQPLLDAFGR